MSNAKKLIIAAVLLVVVAGGAIFWFLRDDSPDEVSLESALEQVTTTTAAEGSDTTEASEPTDYTGTWNLDTETGEFDFESASGTFAGFRITEELSTIGDTEAVGRTGDVTGTLTIDGTEAIEATFQVDLTTLTTNDGRRDDRVQSALDTGEFPTATFALTEPIELGDAVTTGEAVSVTAVGDLEIHGVTQQVEFALDAQVKDGTLVVVGSTEIAFSDFGVSVPEAPIVVSVSDTGTVEVQLLFTR
jgi:polyisoprenoid-binding protein YceI